MSAKVIALVWRRFICRACGLIYDEALGDADSGLAAGTRFDDIPDDWACPLCGVTKAEFEPYDDAPRPPRAPSGPRVPAHVGRAAGVVIVGAGRAGWQMAAELRERDATLPVTMVSACDASLYDKPLLSVAHARNIAPDALVKESAAAAAARLGVRLVTDTHAIRVLAGVRQLRTTRGSLPYTHLVLAHGASPRTSDALPASLCWRINDLHTYRRFRAALGELSNAADAAVASVLIAGAGLVGSELANDLALAGHRVTLIDVKSRPLAALLDTERSAALLDAWRALPLRFEGGVRIAQVVRAPGGGIDVQAHDGRSFLAKHVISATGLETPSRLAVTAGLAWDHGIAVDPETLETSVPTIHALGDCISIDGRAMRYIEPIARQARVIADRITARTPQPYVAKPPPIRVKTTSLRFTA